MPPNETYKEIKSRVKRGEKPEYIAKTMNLPIENVLLIAK